MPVLAESTNRILVAWKPRKRHNSASLAPKPRAILEFQHRDGSREYATMQVVKGLSTYSVTLEYGMSLLASSGDKFKLVEPMVLTVPFHHSDGRREYREVRSILDKRTITGVELDDEEDDPIGGSVETGLPNLTPGGILQMPGTFPTGPEGESHSDPA